MSISNERPYPLEFKMQVVEQVKTHNRLLSDVAKQYGVSSKIVYQWVRKHDVGQPDRKVEIVSEIAHLQQKITQLSQQLQMLAS